jgi:quinol monooxygenase YgiN
MIAVIATIEVKPGSRDAMLKVFKDLTPKVRAEKGCIEYAPMIDLETSLPGVAQRADVVTMIEKWESVEALEAHLMTPHMQEYRKATESIRVDLKLQILVPGL